MAKRETVTDDKPTTIADAAALIPSMEQYDTVLKQYGITVDDQYVPEAPTVYKSNLRQLCKLTTPLYDANGDAIKDVMGHTGPIMYLGKKGEVTPKESRYADYDGFYIYAVLHPKHGETVITIGRPSGDKENPPVVRFLDACKPGAWFQVAEIKTSNAYGVYTVVPVQRSN